MKYLESDLVRIAKRENNTKRGYLVVDPLQGKHVPASPSKVLQLFDELSNTFKDSYKDEMLLLVGFAETATAIGAQAAVSVGSKYIQTTRESIPNVEYLFFSEEHSHATEQKLIKNDIDPIVGDIDRIVFIEDEVTTGKTILNIISILESKYQGKLKFSVASLLNGMSEENLRIYEEKGIPLHYIVKTDHSTYSDRADRYGGDGCYYGLMEKQPVNYSYIEVKGAVNARRLVDAGLYLKACQRLWDEAYRLMGHISNQKILVVGTEETMFPALFVGSKLEELGNMVMSHSTTRSPIMASPENEYPLHTRYQLKSLYDSGRKTFIYDIGEYDKVFIVTDAPKTETEGLVTLINAISAKNKNITLIRWC